MYALCKCIDARGEYEDALRGAGDTKRKCVVTSSLSATAVNWARCLQSRYMFGMQEAARQMIKQGPEAGPYKLINVGSILSRAAFDDVIPYSCSKHATLALITGGAKALVDHNITVNGYGPGVVRTELWEQLDKDLVEIGKFEKEGQSMDSLAENMILMKRYSYPEDVVGTASFLASADSDYMTGQLIMIDSGMIMQ